MDENAVREKLKKLNDAEKLKAEEKNRTISEQNKRIQKLKDDIAKDLLKWDLPMKFEGTDEKAFADINGRPHYLSKKRDTKKLYIVGKHVETMTIDTFIEIRESWGDEKALLLLKERIPGFVEYLTNKFS